MLRFEAMKLLKLHEGYSAEEVDKSWKLAMLTNHPDLHRNSKEATELVIKMNEARELLKATIVRKEVVSFDPTEVAKPSPMKPNTSVAISIAEKIATCNDPCCETMWIQEGDEIVQYWDDYLNRYVSYHFTCRFYDHEPCYTK